MEATRGGKQAHGVSLMIHLLFYRTLPLLSIIRVEASALCHTELHFADGTLNLGVAPITLGHEAVGVITAVGSDVPPSRIGQRVSR